MKYTHILTSQEAKIKGAPFNLIENDPDNGQPSVQLPEEYYGEEEQRGNSAHQSGQNGQNRSGSQRTVNSGTSSLKAKKLDELFGDLDYLREKCNKVRKLCEENESPNEKTSRLK